HDALRMVFREDLGNWVQENKGLDHPLSLEEQDLRGVMDSSTALSESAAAIQSSLSLESGPLMKAVIYHTDQGDKLLIVIHHLVMDGISWRILLEDLQDLYDQKKQGTTNLALSKKTASFRDWSLQMKAQAGS